MQSHRRCDAPQTGHRCEEPNDGPVVAVVHHQHLLSLVVGVEELGVRVTRRRDEVVPGLADDLLLRDGRVERDLRVVSLMSMPPAMRPMSQPSGNNAATAACCSKNSVNATM